MNFYYYQTANGIYGSKPQRFELEEERQSAYEDAYDRGHGEFVDNCESLQLFEEIFGEAEDLIAVYGHDDADFESLLTQSKILHKISQYVERYHK